MPKIKTRRCAAKRFKVNASGKIKRGSAYRRHILVTKTTKNKRQLRASAFVDGTQLRNIKRLIPYA